MIPAHNPYNCTAPGSLFVGYEQERGQIMQGFRDGNSYAILGGRRCGKTSLLLQLVRDLQSNGLQPFEPLPRFLDIQEFNRLTPALLFEKVYNLVIQDVQGVPWVASTPESAYQDFLAHLDAAKPLLDIQYGAHWLVILLIDELDAAIDKLTNDHFFQNLRNLLMVSRFRSHFRLVASGVQEMARLTTSGSSPLNNLRNRYVRILTVPEAHQLIAYAFPQDLAPAIAASLDRVTGRHPYLLQGLLENLWMCRDVLDEPAVDLAARAFLREHHDFYRWLEAFSLAEHAVYQCLSEARGDPLHLRDLRQRIDTSLRYAVDDALSVLSYHGVIDDSEPARPRIAGTLFQAWYQHNGPRGPAPSPARTLHLFYSYSHKDGAMREALETHLTLLQRQGIITTWNDRQITAGQEWKAQIDRHLEEADIILFLVSADFLASDYCYEIEMQRALERHRAGEALVIPVIIRTVELSGAPFTGLQYLPSGKPVSRWDDPDDAWTNVAQGIRRAVEEWKKR